MGFSIHFGSGPHHHDRGPRGRRHYGPRRGYSSGGIVVTSPIGKFFFGLIFAVIGAFVLLVGTGVIGGKNTDGFVETKGRVVDYHEKWDSDSGYMYAVIVEYVVGEQSYEIQSNSYSTNPKRIGSVVDVKYNPVAPRDAVISDAGESGLILVSVVGGVFTLVGVIVMGSSFFGRKKNNDELEESAA